MGTSDIIKLSKFHLTVALFKEKLVICEIYSGYIISLPIGFTEYIVIVCCLLNI